MYLHGQPHEPNTIERRKELGGWLKNLRRERGLTQTAVAVSTGCFYTFISALEAGRGRIPPDQYKAWANVLGVPPAEFVKELLKYYDPISYRILFGSSTEHGQPSGTEQSIHGETGPSSPSNAVASRSR